MTRRPGTVYLVGAGPGDPGLVTVRGAEVLAACDVVVYDRLAPSALLALVPPSAERIDVGKRPRIDDVDQDAINDVLVARARSGLNVVRLKGGDPFVFGRGGEEALALAAAGIPFEVVPGVSAAIAAPAYAGIPVTHRGVSGSVTVVTGHGESGAPDVDWEAIAAVGGTVVILMGVSHRAEIARRLVDGGLDPSTPVAVVRWGTRTDQTTVRTVLGELGGGSLAHVRPPAAIVVGGVAAFDLAWFETKPLFGWNVVVTRARAQASTLAAALRSRGAGVVEMPVISFADPDDGGAGLRSALAGIGGYDWVVLTSANGADRFLGELTGSGRDARALGGTRVAAIGPGTAAVLRGQGIVADLVPGQFVAESLVAAFPDRPGAGEAAGDGRVLIPRAAAARDVLPLGLAAKGWVVEVVAAYRTVRPEVAPEVLKEAQAADAVTFTSSSTVDGYVETAGLDAIAPVVACIGPVTAETARRHGIRVDVVATEHTVAGLATALEVFAADRRQART